MSTRRILRLSGADARSFLQGLVTNDVAGLDQGLVYAALLTPQGKYLADFFLTAEGEDVLLDVDAALAEGLVKRLGMYRLRAAVEIEETGLQVKRGTGPAPEGALADPRHPDMGWRLYGAEGGDEEACEHGDGDQPEPGEDRGHRRGVSPVPAHYSAPARSSSRAPIRGDARRHIVFRA